MSITGDAAADIIASATRLADQRNRYRTERNAVIKLVLGTLLPGEVEGVAVEQVRDFLERERADAQQLWEAVVKRCDRLEAALRDLHTYGVGAGQQPDEKYIRSIIDQALAADSEPVA